MEADPGPAARWPAFLSWGGFLLSFAASTSYFLVVPRISFDLRDSGHLNVAAGALGVVLSLAAILAARRAQEKLKPRVICCLAALGLSSFLATYIYYLSYQLPPSQQVLAVGSRAPDFRLKDQNGIERTLGDFKDRRLVLVFFRGHW